MKTIPETDQIKATVEHMENHFSVQEGEGAQSMWQAYIQLAKRFETDLANERDLWISKAAALMMLKYQQECAG